MLNYRKPSLTLGPFGVRLPRRGTQMKPNECRGYMEPVGRQSLPRFDLSRSAAEPDNWSEAEGLGVMLEMERQ